MFLGLFRGQSVAFSSPGGGCGAPWLSAERPRWGIFFFFSLWLVMHAEVSPNLAWLRSRASASQPGIRPGAKKNNNKKKKRERRKFSWFYITE